VHNQKMRVLPESSAYFLIAHGSRDPRSRRALEACAMFVRQALDPSQSLEQAWPFVGSGVLEFGDRPLAVQIETFAKTASRDGVRQIFLLPLFLMSGNHVNQDLPEAMQGAQHHSVPELILCPHLGSHPDIHSLVRDRMNETPCDRWILLAHGTRRSYGNQSVEILAEQLNATPAFWATKPDLETQLETLVGGNIHQRVGIVPYFLFTGSIIDVISKDIHRLKSRFSALDLQMTQPLNPSAQMAKLLLDRCASVSALQRCGATEF
jgi:sirohydrochlorin cobaltochelatase